MPTNLDNVSIVRDRNNSWFHKVARTVNLFATNQDLHAKRGEEDRSLDLCKGDVVEQQTHWLPFRLAA